MHQAELGRKTQEKPQQCILLHNAHSQGVGKRGNTAGTNKQMDFKGFYFLGFKRVLWLGQIDKTNILN